MDPVAVGGDHHDQSKLTLNGNQQITDATFASAILDSEISLTKLGNSRSSHIHITCVDMIPIRRYKLAPTTKSFAIGTHPQTLSESLANLFLKFCNLRFKLSELYVGIYTKKLQI
jgi:hypothetical protein